MSERSIHVQAALGVALLCMFAPAHMAAAKPSRWTVESHPIGLPIAQIAGRGPVRMLGVACERQVPILVMDLPKPPAQDVLWVVLNIGGTSSGVSLFQNESANLWVGEVMDAQLLARLTTGKNVRLSLDGTHYATLSLRGSGSAIRQVVDNCAASGDTAPATQPTG